jgi:large subunit ribosomal protein L28
MAKICDICGRKQVSGNRVSHSHKKTRRKWNINLQRVNISENGNKSKKSVCTRCIKSGRVKRAV